MRTIREATELNEDARGRLVASCLALAYRVLYYLLPIYITLVCCKDRGHAAAGRLMARDYMYNMTGASVRQGAGVDRRVGVEAGALSPRAVTRFMDGVAAARGVTVCTLCGQWRSAKTVSRLHCML